MFHQFYPADQERTHILKDAPVRNQVRSISNKNTSAYSLSIFRQFCGDEGDRTLNLRLAKPALSQLSYIPNDSCEELMREREWWARVDSNHPPHAYQACALTN